jgi:Coenzyme PQQ synthesis protein D (PqqD)
MAVSFNMRVRIPEEVIFRELDGESVVLNIESGIYFGLDGVGTQLWQWLAESGSLQSVRVRMADAFDAPAEQLDADLIAFVEELTSKGLLAVA